MSDAGYDVSIFSIETRIKSVRAESRVVKDPIAILAPQLEERSRLPSGDVVGGQPCGGDTDHVSGVTTTPTLSRVRIIPVEDVSGPDINVGIPQVGSDVLSLEHGGGEAAHAARPGLGDDDGGGAEIHPAPECRVQRDRGLIQQRLKNTKY